MKKYLLYTAALVLCGLAFSSCSKDELDETSVITVSKTEKNDFDRWLEVNYVNPYNIDFKYRYEETESNLNYYTIPAEYNQAVEMAHILKYICIEAYDEVVGIDFTREYFPKMFFLIGEWEYQNNGTIILGTAEGGKKILLTGINYLDQYKTSYEDLTHYYLKTIHHEFTHIMNQTKPMPTDFQYVSADTYIGGVWNTAPYNGQQYFLERGHVSAYSEQEYSEDFAEMMSMYVCYPQETWDQWFAIAGAEGTEILKQKLSIVRRYMQESWGFDIDDLRAAIQRRAADLKAGKIDLHDLSIN